MSVNVKFDDYELDDVSEWEENIDSRVSETTIPRRHGSYHEDDFVYTSRHITLRGTIFRASWNDVRTELWAMKKRLSRGTKRLYFDDEYYIWAILQNFNHSHSAVRGQGAVADFSVSFICKDPFWYDIDSSQEQDTSMADDDSIVVTNNGNILTYPTLTITSAGSTTGISITNSHVDINQYIKYDATLTSGELLVIDHDECTMEKDTTNVLNDFLGDFWGLGVGSNTLTVAIDSGSNISLTIDYRERNV